MINFPNSMFLFSRSLFILIWCIFLFLRLSILFVFFVFFWLFSWNFYRLVLLFNKIIWLTTVIRLYYFAMRSRKTIRGHFVKIINWKWFIWLNNNITIHHLNFRVTICLKVIYLYMTYLPNNFNWRGLNIS